jgi:preprotein translocase subunit SecG|tara:strand:- start:23 stop:238 length:216 start_codon:yes stop_codon:yes gene_type:complete
MKLVQNLWFFCSIGLILSIMVHNPKSQGMIGQNQVFNGTRSAEETLDKITWALIGTFFVLTVYISTFSQFE